MVKLRIIKLNNYDYELTDDNGIIHKSNIEFYNLKRNPSVFDYIYIEEKLLTKIENQMVNFELIDKENIKHQEEIIVLEYQDGEKVYLTRVYG